ncbi:uncharacterized protein EAE97_002648 [Botrytis byssoidea]|uniref:Uncharacterized protein n=1 Tax=Botrytis byssoidea TaxID=139641 RepID=A0A9P5IRK7_9HELO|nr:uncharacterized protein EAE97_002648 [Botrytis byssoidea]KAF7951097.1 hypothetical protein EAE97_002648 [Botrytis byssoidea]
MATTLPQPEIALVILDHVDFFDVDKLIVFVGTVYLPYLQVEQNNNPLSPVELWERSGYTDGSEVEGTSNGNRLIIYHEDSGFDRDFKAHLMKNCKFVVELFIKKPIHDDANLKPAQVPNLELQLVLIDRVLESKAKEVHNKKRKSTISA